MLEDLTIKDFAIIESEYIEFSNGFNVLSGETGAGKSILIGALSFLLGGKAEMSQIRSGCHEANVSATFYLNQNEQDAIAWLDEHSISMENNRILLRRYIRDTGKTAAWIGDTPVTKNDLQDFSAFLVDIHGQHDHQSLMKVCEHRKFLDARAGIVKEVENFKLLYENLVEKRRVLENLNASDSQRENTIQMLRFAISEITQAKLRPKEDEELETEENRLSSYEKLYASVENLRIILDGNEESVVSLLKKARRESQNAFGIDKTLGEIDSRLESCFYEILDITSNFADYESKLIFDPAHLQEIQERLSLIYNLKKKYASSQNAPLSEVFDYLQKATEQLENLESGSQNKDSLLQEISALEKKAYIDAKNISAKRKALSEKLSVEVEEILKTLGMADARFVVNITEKPGNDIEQKCGPYGMDNIEFLISANVGAPLLPLAKIASGGEISRVMLALKTVFAQNDTVGTLVFDEIDSGIGGEIAVSLGRHIQNLAKNHQIFCITHLASIAVYADNQYKIEKAAVKGKTASTVHQVFGDERVSEIARMLAGDSSTQASLEHAKSMLEKAHEKS